MMDRETAHQIRGIASRAVVRSVNDNGETQTAMVTVYKHVDRSEVEVLQPYGISSRPPAGKGNLCVVFAIGGDQGDLVALPIGCPSLRLGKLEPGEVAIHGRDGSRVHIKADGTIDVVSSKAVRARVKTASIEVTETLVRGQIAPAGARFVASADHAKVRTAAHHLVVTAAGVFSSVPVVVGPDPHPDL